MAETNAENKEVATRESSEVQTHEPEALLRAPVDIFEDAEGITLLADMPGVNRDSLNLHVDKDSLIVEGDARIDMPEGMEALYADVRSTRYRRSFALSGELETDRIEASLKDGVLRVHIPKRAEARPRKIEIRTG
jgi:HSP20 family molecular chaperone IbpA